MLLQYLLEDLDYEEVIGKTDINIGKIEYDSKRLQKNVDIFKRRLRDIIEAQLSLVEEIDKEDL